MANTIQELVTPGIRLELVYENKKLTKEPDEDDVESYVTKVFDVAEDKNVVEALMPMDKTKLILLPVDAIYDAFFYCKKGIYGCKVKVTARYKENSLFIVALEQLTELKKQQRREYFRFDCIIGMNTRQLTEKEHADFLEHKNVSLLPLPEGKSVIVDLSGGGMRFISADHYDVGSSIYCRFTVLSGDSRKVFGCVMNVIATKPVENNARNTEYRGNFICISNADREAIIKFIFEEERKSRQRK